MTNEQMRNRIGSIRATFGPRNSHMLIRQLAGDVSLRTIERWRRIAGEVGLAIETRPDGVYLALPLNGVTGNLNAR